jgi:hypothetical protein
MSLGHQAGERVIGRGGREGVTRDECPSTGWGHYGPLPFPLFHPKINQQEKEK